MSLAEDVVHEGQSEHLPEDQIEQPQRHVGIMPNRRSPQVNDPDPSSGTPQGHSCFAVLPGLGLGLSVVTTRRDGFVDLGG